MDIFKNRNDNGMIKGLKQVLNIQATSKNVIARSKATKQSQLLLQKRDCFAEFILSEAEGLAVTN